MVLNVYSDREEALGAVVYGYIMSYGKGKVTLITVIWSAFRLGEDQIIGEWGSMDDKGHEIELLALEHKRAMRIDTPTNSMTEAIYKSGDEVLVVKRAAIGRVSKYPRFYTKSCGP